MTTQTMQSNLKEQEKSVYPAGEATYCTEPDQGLPIRYAQSGLAAQKFTPVPHTLEEVCQMPSMKDKVAFRVEADGYPKDKIGTWVNTTWGQYRDQSRQFARALLSCGFVPYEAVAICGFNGPYWMIGAMGTMYAVGMCAGTYTTNTPNACKYVADHSKSRVVVVDTVATLKKYLEVELDTVHHIVVAREEVPQELVGRKTTKGDHTDRDFVVSWSTFMQWGSEVTEDALTERMGQLKLENCAALIYTSGTTGNPKAVMISHDTAQFAGRSGQLSIGGGTWEGFIDGKKELRSISYLPLSHVAALAIDLIGPLLVAKECQVPFVVSFARPDVMKGSLPVTLKGVRPTLFFGVPRVWEKFVEGIKAKGKAEKPSGLKLKIVQLAKKQGLKYSQNRQVGGSGARPGWYGLCNKLVYTKVKDALGLDQSNFLITGAAPIQPETQNFLASLGMDILEVYGMSEGAGNGTIGSNRRFLFGAAGAPLVSEEVRIDHVEGRDKPGEGEICFRGRHVMMGYLRDEAKTQETIDAEGWLHSGDVGRLDESLQLRIVGRIKELVITAGGENIAPVPIEDEIKRLCPALSNVVLIGDRRKYNVVLVTLKAKQDLETGAFTDELVGEAAEVSQGAKTVTAARSGDSAWTKYIEQGIKQYNSGSVCVSNAQKVQKFAILPTDLSVLGGELTGTLKIKRGTVVEKYSDVIEDLYKE